jgi:hypothetical protein
MKKLLITSIRTLATLAVIALLCTYVYRWNNLDQIFGAEISFLQWVAIILIANVLFPAKDIFKHEEKKDDNKGSKIPRDISSHGF